MKNTLLVLLLMAAGGMAFAGGSQDKNSDEDSRRPMGRDREEISMQQERREDGMMQGGRLQRGPLVDIEELDGLESSQIDGTLIVEYGQMLLSSGDEEYKLCAPGFAALDIELNDGDSLSVTGKLIQTGDIEDFDDFIGKGDGVIFVESGEINGESYELNTDFVEGYREGRSDSMRGRR